MGSVRDPRLGWSCIMSTPLYFAAKSISMSKRSGRKPQTLLMAAKHNLREHHAEFGAAENIMLEHSHRNIILHGPTRASDIVDMANGLMIKYAVPKRKLREDHVQALEFVISVRSDSIIDEMAYFMASKRWFIEVFGHEMLLSVVVHYDESEPHMHALILPFVNGHYQGGAPIGKTNLPKLINRFADDVGKPYGLSFKSKPKVHVTQRTAAFNLVIDHLSRQSDPVITSRVWRVVAERIKHAPQDFLEVLGLEMPHTAHKATRTMAQIFTSTGKKTDEDRRIQMGQDLSCVGQGHFSAPFNKRGAKE
jgi:hypothetical protein